MCQLGVSKSSQVHRQYYPPHWHISSLWYVLLFSLFWWVFAYSSTGSHITSSEKSFLTYSSTELSQLNTAMMLFEWLGFLQDFILKLNPWYNMLGGAELWELIELSGFNLLRGLDWGKEAPSTEFKTPFWKHRDPIKSAGTSVLSVSVSIPWKNEFPFL